MSACTLESKFKFGLNASIGENCKFLNNNTVGFIAGVSLALYNREEKTQRFVSLTAHSVGISRFCFSPNERFIALAEYGLRPTVCLYDVMDFSSCKRSLSSVECSDGRFVSIAFSNDSKYLAAYGIGPVHVVLLWMWEKGKLLATARLDQNASPSQRQVSFNPLHSTLLCISGPYSLQLLRYQEDSLKPSPLLKNDTAGVFTCHTWYSGDVLVVGTVYSTVMLFHAEKFKTEYLISKDGIVALPRVGNACHIFPSDELPPSSVTCLIPWGRLIVCSLSDGRIVFLTLQLTTSPASEVSDVCIQLVEEVPTISLSTASLDSIDRKTPVYPTWLGISPQKHLLCASTSDCQLLCAPLPKEDQLQEEIPSFKPLFANFHMSSVTYMDVSCRKPLVVTAGLDKMVRLWNFHSCSMELQVSFPDEIFCVALHPNGLFLALCFLDKLRLFNIFLDEVKSFREYPIRSCRECVFSHGGHLIAAVQGSLVQVISMTTLEVVATLKGHSGKVRSLIWSRDDARLVTAGVDGAVYEWDTVSYHRTSECVLKSCSYSCTAMSTDNKVVYAIGSDRTLKEISNAQILKQILMEGVIPTQLLVVRDGKTLVVGTAEGRLMLCPLPLVQPIQWNTLPSHADGITKIKSSLEGQHIFTCGQDGLVTVYHVKDGEGRLVSPSIDIVYAEEVLITRTQVDEMLSQISELETQVSELKMENSYQLRLRDLQHVETLRELKQEHSSEIEELRQNLELMGNERNQMEIIMQQRFHCLQESNQKELDELGSTQNRRLLSEYEKFQELLNHCHQLEQEHSSQIKILETAHQTKIEQLEKDFETRLQRLEQMLAEATASNHQTVVNLTEERCQIENDADSEIIDIKTRYEHRLREEKENNLHLKGESGILKKKISNLQKDLEDQKADTQKLLSEQVKLQTNIKSLERDITSLKKEVRERDEAIQEKEKRIHELKKKNQELEKFRFVLDNRIKELKGLLEPKEDEITALKDQICEMEAELENFHKRNEELQRNISDLHLKLTCSGREVKSGLDKVFQMEVLLKNMRLDIHQCSTWIDDVRRLKSSVTDMYHKYVVADVIEQASLGDDVKQEYDRQTEHLERTVLSLRRQLEKTTRAQQNDVNKVIRENVSLIEEVNDLRRELKILRTKNHDLEGTLERTQTKRSAFDPKSVGLIERRSPYAADATTMDPPHQRRSRRSQSTNSEDRRSTRSLPLLGKSIS